MKNTHESWKKASYVTERKILPEQPRNTGEEQVKAWRSRTGLERDEIYIRRITEDGFDHKQFAQLLSQTDDFELNSENSWVNTFNRVFAQYIDEEAFADSELLDNHPFQTFLQPFLIWARNELQAASSEWQTMFGELSFDWDAILEGFMQTLRLMLSEISGRTIIAELHTVCEQGQLRGESPEDRYNCFLRSRLTGKEQILQLLRKYPVLARLLTEMTEKKLRTTSETLERFIKDRCELEKKWGVDFSQLYHITLQAGDSHKGGQSVAVLHFRSGHKLVYKPRSLEMDDCFQQLLVWLNERGDHPSLPVLKIWNRGEYGWSEFVEAKPCEEEKQVQRFYHRHGSYLAILYLLQAADFHHGNVIASGEYPYLIDLEALFYRYTPTEGSVSATDKASGLLLTSVLRTGLLPASRFKSGMFNGVEISGIGAHSGQILQQQVYRYENIGTDQMMLVKAQIPLAKSNNRPIWNGIEVRAEEYTDQIVRGFEEMYQLIAQHKEELLAEEGPIKRFKGVDTRVLIRSTQVYAKMLEASLHPSNLTDGLQRVQLFDFMWRLAETHPVITQLIHSECKDLLDHDIPYFSSKVDSRDIWDSRGKKFEGYWPVDSFTLVCKQLASMSKEDCQRQINHTHLAMLTLEQSWELRLTDRKNETRKPEHLTYSNQQFLEASIKIADDLATTAIWGDDRQTVSWLGTGVDEFGQLRFSPLDFGIYDGSLGLVLYYAYLAKETGNKSYEQIAKAALNSSMEWLQKPGTIESGSLFYGYAAYCYTFIHLAALWNEPEWLKRALTFLPQLERMMMQDRKWDLIAGTAGILFACIKLYSATGDQKALQLAIACGNRLIEHAKALPQGIGWVSDLTRGHPLAGLSHGASGYALVLTELAMLSGEERFGAAAQRAIQYERTLFSEEHGNWIDLRHGDQKYPVQWCHGDLGNLDVLLFAATSGQDHSLQEAVYQLAARSLNEANADGWFTGIPDGLDTPGLLVGKSGIGYALLRLANPSVPSILALETPVMSILPKESTVL
ncbi:type 2 lanthipeptide synthetase LanM family protein [Brevibacillus sp. SYSU BS000544]|uniref:type 2 lanthipeptide synthetase LanM family protein n=1 Tax=Brevibacillus sp. SYSU BS000544 TaxID=3416443 RepID=UPI003CE55017